MNTGERAVSFPPWVESVPNCQSRERGNDETKEGWHLKWKWKAFAAAAALSISIDCRFNCSCQILLQTLSSHALHSSVICTQPFLPTKVGIASVIS